MSEHDDVTVQYWNDHREQIRQSESQRAVLTNYLLVVAAGVGGLVVQQKLAPVTLPLSLLVVLVGAYGALSTAKYHERAEYHLTQARALTHAMVDAGTLTDHTEVLDQARQAHYDGYPRLARVRLHLLWTGLHIGILVFGATLAVITIIRW